MSTGDITIIGSYIWSQVCNTRYVRTLNIPMAEWTVSTGKFHSYSGSAVMYGKDRILKCGLGYGDETDPEKEANLCPDDGIQPSCAGRDRGRTAP
jgi:hypothetical protein